MGKRVFAIGALVALLATGVVAAPPGAGASTEAAPRAATEVLAVDAGETSSCGLDAAGAAFCWGTNYKGELGDGTTTNSLLPVAVARGELPSDATFTTVTMAGDHACALTQAGRPYCWGGAYLREGEDRCRSPWATGLSP